MFDDDDDDGESLPYVVGSKTSKAAAKKAAKGGARKMARYAFDAIIEAGDRGMTTDELNELFERFGRGTNGMTARVQELAQSGMITRGPDERLTRSNAGADVNRAIPEAIGNFDLYYRRYMKQPELRAMHMAVQALTRLARRVGKQAIEASPELPTLEDTQRLFAEAVLAVYANLRAR